MMERKVRAGARQARTAGKHRADDETRELSNSAGQWGVSATVSWRVSWMRKAEADPEEGVGGLWLMGSVAQVGTGRERGLMDAVQSKLVAAAHSVQSQKERERRERDGVELMQSGPRNAVKLVESELIDALINIGCKHDDKSHHEMTNAVTLITDFRHGESTRSRQLGRRLRRALWNWCSRRWDQVEIEEIG